MVVRESSGGVRSMSEFWYHAVMQRTTGEIETKQGSIASNLPQNAAEAVRNMSKNSALWDGELCQLDLHDVDYETNAISFTTRLSWCKEGWVRVPRLDWTAPDAPKVEKLTYVSFDPLKIGFTITRPVARTYQTITLKEKQE